jgi:hypothetical protein
MLGPLKNEVGINMKPKWIFERGVHDHGIPEKMMAHAKEMGMEAIEVVFSESSQHFKGILDVKLQKKLPFANTDCVIMFGSFSMAQYLLRNHPWTPGVWFDKDALSCQTYLSHWGKFSLQDGYAMMPLAEVRRQKDWLFQWFGNGHYDNKGAVFIRPDSQLKQFAGQSVDYLNFDKFWNEAMVYGEPTTLALVATPKKIRHEWRTVVCDRKCVTGSRYIKDGQVDIDNDFPDNVKMYVEAIVNSTEWQPSATYCVDVCEEVVPYGVPGVDPADCPTQSQLRLLEIGSVNTCGLYDCDLKIVVEKMSEVAEREWLELQS